jgi:hypothetical protein
MEAVVKVKVDPRVIDICIQRAGLRRGPFIAEFIATWAIYDAERERSGQAPSVDAFSMWWRERTPRSAYKRLASFREAFPEYSTPSDMAVATVTAPEMAELYDLAKAAPA